MRKKDSGEVAGDLSSGAVRGTEAAWQWMEKQQRGRDEGRAGPVGVCRAPLLRVVGPETPACRDALVSLGPCL